MDNLLSQHSLDSAYIPTPLVQQIICYVGDQSKTETKFENLQSLLRCKRVNKKWYKLATAEYDRLREVEGAVVINNYVQDYEYVATKKHIQTFTNTYAHQDKKRACAIQRNLIVWLHDSCHKGAKPLTEQLYCYDDKEIYPITWAHFMDAHASRRLLSHFVDHTSLLHQTSEALAAKDAFDALNFENRGMMIEPMRPRYSKQSRKWLE